MVSALLEKPKERSLSQLQSDITSSPPVGPLLPKSMEPQNTRILLRASGSLKPGLSLPMAVRAPAANVPPSYHLCAALGQK